MKKFLLVQFFFFISFISIFAQKKAAKTLIGSWESNGITINGVFYSQTDGTEVITLYSGNVFQDFRYACYTDSSKKTECDTGYIRTGEWDLLRKNKLVYSKYHTTPNWGSFAGGDDTTIIKSLNDTALVLCSTEKEPYYVYYYKKIETVKKIPDYILSPVIDTTKKQEIFLVNAADSSRKIKIDKEQEMDFVIHDTANYYEKEILSGHPLDVNDTLLSCSIYSEDKNHYEKEEDFIEYSNCSWNVSENRKIEINKLVQITYSSPMRTSRFAFGAAFLGFSCLDVFLVAPLVSIKYQQGGFNAPRYFTWAGIGLCGLAVSIPLMAFNQPKKYLITSKNLKREKNYWYFEKY